MKKILASFVWTEDARRAADVIEEACCNRDVVLVLGAPGSGRSTLLHHLYSSREFERNIDRRVACVEARVPSTARSVTRAVLEALGRVPRATSLEDQQWLAWLLPALNMEAIVVDEAQRLSAPALDILRSLVASTGIGLVLCGTPRAERVLIARCPELAHRLRRIHQLEQVGFDDLKILLGRSPTFRGRRDMTNFTRVLVEASKGNLRQIEQALDEAKRWARRHHRSIDVRLLRRVVDDSVWKLRVESRHDRPA